MKPFRHLIILVALAFSLILIADGAEASPRAPKQTAAEQKRLQGKWEGVMVGQEKGDKITITITGNSLHFHRDTNFWFETTFTLPAGTDPKQLHATIKDCADKDSIGKVVFAIFKIEDGTLTLAGIRTPDSAPEPPVDFDSEETMSVASNSGRFNLKRRIPNHPKRGPQNSLICPRYKLHLAVTGEVALRWCGARAKHRFAKPCVPKCNLGTRAILRPRLRNGRVRD
jgi:uncharacterized protein (TIGR03067 family)